MPDPVKYAIPLFIVLVLAELVYARLTNKVRYEVRDATTSLLMGYGSTLSGALLGAWVVSLYYEMSSWRLFTLSNAWWVWVLCFIADDIAYYWFHRTAHQIRWFWASHSIHHSSQHYNLTTALRQTWTGPLSLAFIFKIPLLLLGFPLEMILFCAGLNLIYQFWIHTEAIKRCPAWFEAVMNTPSHHRVHHATNPRYLDANYAGVFILWDKLFGTYVPECVDDPCRYGLVHNLLTFNPVRVAFHEWRSMTRDLRQARSLREGFGYVFGPPGWSAKGNGQTSAQIKAQWRAQGTVHAQKSDGL
jgi:sterol desaturase/sphingolipid hydroxylase (fatty acid hydroxylase superfamily)